MKRNYKKLLMIILLSFVLTGCSRQYRAEKAFFKASKYSEDIFKDPKNIPPYKFEKALSNFERIIKKYPKTSQAREAEFLIGNLYFIKEQYDKAIGVFEKIQKGYTDDKLTAAKAKILTAKTYEKKGDWSNALQNYRQAFDKYKDVPEALSIPVYILSYYQNKKDTANIPKAYEQAVADYSQLIKEHSKSEVAYFAGDLLVQTHIRLAKWLEAIQTIQDLLKDYPQSPQVPLWVMTIGAIYQNQIKDLNKAKTYYEKLVQEYPKSPWVKEAKTRLEELNKHK